MSDRDRAQRLLAWYDRHRRVLPWRALPGERTDPYRVWLSEIMLQQTTVVAVGPYFARFLELWPRIEDLAAALGTVVEQRFSGAINLGTGVGTTVQEMACGLAELLGRPELVELINPPEPDSFPYVVADVTRLKGLGLQSAWPLAKGLKAMTAS